MSRPGISYAGARQLAASSRGEAVAPGAVVPFQWRGRDLLAFHPDGTVVLTVPPGSFAQSAEVAAMLAAARDVLQVTPDVLGVARRRMHWDGQTFRCRVAIDADGRVLTDMAASL